MDNNRKRHRQSLLSPILAPSSSSSSVSSVSSGDQSHSNSDPSYINNNHHSNNNKASRKKSQSNNKNQSKSRSFFSGFWPGSELEVDPNTEDGNKDQSRKKKHKKRNSNNNNNSTSGSNSNSNSNNNRTKIDYAGFYLTIGDTIYEIGVGDVVAMRNSVEAEYEAPPTPQQTETTTPTSGVLEGTSNSNAQSDGENSRERRRKRRLDRNSIDLSIESKVPESKSDPTKTASASPVAPPSSDYAVDALSEKTSNYYKVVPDGAGATVTPIAIANKNTTNGDGSSGNLTAGGSNPNGNSGAKNLPGSATSAIVKGSAHIDSDVAMTDADDVAAATVTVPASTNASFPASIPVPVPHQAPPSSTLPSLPDSKPTPIASASAATSFQKPPPPQLQMPVRELKRGDGLMLARVERIWQERRRGSGSHNNNNNNNSSNTGNGGGKVLFKARWFLKKEDVDSLPLGEITGPMSSEAFAKSITQHDLVLSNQSDDNHVTTICDIVQVLYRNPNLDTDMPSLVLPATYLCRYSLCIDDRVVVLPYTGDNDDWKEMTVSALNSRKRSVLDAEGSSGETSGKGEKEHFLHNLMAPQGKSKSNKKKRGNSSDDDDDSQDYGIANQKRRRVGDFADPDEGITEQRDIQVGKRHQVNVPTFVPNQNYTIGSRKPVLLWKPDRISQEGTDDYIERAAQILTPYLRKHNLTQEEPYAPFPTRRMEELSKSLSTKRLPTLSSVSSVSSLTTHAVDALREYNIDALLRNLHVSNYNVVAAIAAIEASPMDYLVAWNQHEKTRFNTGFRRYSGSLRAIYKGMGNKALPEVIDYHYRFKIPDQFRKVQERKREQAIRMLECIETKRNLNAPIVVSGGIHGGGAPSGITVETQKEKGDWTKTGSSSLAISLEERRVKAKELLLDVESKLGRNKMMKVFEIFKSADETALTECKTKLLDIFRGHQEFQSRFLEFLPHQLRL